MTIQAGRVSVVTVSFGHGHCLPAALHSLHLLSGVLAEVLVVDNTGDLGGEVTDHGLTAPLRCLTPGRNLGYAAAANLATTEAAGELLLFLSPDAELLRFDHHQVVAQLDGTTGLVGAETIDRRHRRVVSWGEFPGARRVVRRLVGLRRITDTRRLRQLAGGATVRCDWVVGAAVVLRRQTFSTLGGFDERYVAAGEDQDFGLRLQGCRLRSLVSPSWQVRHQVRDSRSPEMAREILANDLRWLADHGSAWDRLVVRTAGALRPSLRVARERPGDRRGTVER